MPVLLNVLYCEDDVRSVNGTPVHLDLTIKAMMKTTDPDYMKEGE